MEAYDLLGGRAAGATGRRVKRQGLGLPSLFAPDLLLEELPFRDLLLAALNMQGHPASDPPLEFQRGTGAALQLEARALCSRNVNGNSNSEG